MPNEGIEKKNIFYNSNGGGMRKHKQTFKGYSKHKSNLKRTKKNVTL
jgi:hypothetical protein